jgi:peptidase A4-like protein
MPKLRRRLCAVCSVSVLGVLIAAPSAGSIASTGIFHRPRVAVSRPGTRDAGWASSNWSGYAVTGSVYNSVTAKWIVPAVAASRKATYSSDWVGIDGYNNSNLIQTGTESDYYNGSPHYAAWWEILPAAETVIPSITVKPGDTVTASITKGSGSSWTIRIADGGKSFTTTQTYTGPQTSAEWIEEAPTVGGRVAPLANYGQTTFDPGTVNGANPLLNTSEAGVMVQKRVQVSTPSNPDGDTDGFNIAYGATAPAPPPS